MSFGVSVGDIVAIATLTERTYSGWKNACGDYTKITEELKALNVILERVEIEARSPSSVFARNPEDLYQWRTLLGDIKSIMLELEEILGRFKSLSRSRRRNWDRIRMGFTNHEEIRRRLNWRTAGLSSFLSVLSLSSQGRLESRVLPELIRKVEDLAAQIRAGNETVMTTYEDDDREVWRQFPRDLIRSGFKSGVVHEHSAAIQTYIRQLARSGRLEEDVPEEYPSNEERDDGMFFGVRSTQNREPGEDHHPANTCINPDSDHERHSQESWEDWDSSDVDGSRSMTKDRSLATPNDERDGIGLGDDENSQFPPPERQQNSIIVDIDRFEQSRNANRWESATATYISDYQPPSVTEIVDDDLSDKGRHSGSRNTRSIPLSAYFDTNAIWVLEDKSYWYNLARVILELYIMGQSKRQPFSQRGNRYNSLNETFWRKLACGLVQRREQMEQKARNRCQTLSKEDWCARRYEAERLCNLIKKRMEIAGYSVADEEESAEYKTWKELEYCQRIVESFP